MQVAVEASGRTDRGIWFRNTQFSHSINHCLMRDSMRSGMNFGIDRAVAERREQCQPNLCVVSHSLQSQIWSFCLIRDLAIWRNLLYCKKKNTANYLQYLHAVALRPSLACCVSFPLIQGNVNKGMDLFMVLVRSKVQLKLMALNNL